MEGEPAGVLGPLPQTVTAMARWRLGQTAEARRALARAVVSFDWSPANAGGADHWIYHALRREAEAMVLPDLAAVLDGRHQPSDASERLAMTGACQFRELHAAQARLWADANDADPTLAAPARVYAVRAAVLAGCGRGNDAAALSDADRARFRAQAREWFQAELAAASNANESRQSEAKARAILSAWRTSPDLAAVRGAASLARLPAPERQEWTLLWQRAARVAEGQ
jgi:eukaryotic-like serine/threonine-protein kinase